MTNFVYNDLDSDPDHKIDNILELGDYMFNQDDNEFEDLTYACEIHDELYVNAYEIMCETVSWYDEYYSDDGMIWFHKCTHFNNLIRFYFMMLWGWGLGAELLKELYMPTVFKKLALMRMGRNQIMDNYLQQKVFIPRLKDIVGE